ncbi:bifunctional UDP-N-acetylglucosamine diphosphorylase/glucosamine-1-phosphate N-acetyltransferase GlmU [Frankia sp. AgKG'84/4]|uniref:bifunctional UDP-N-acetylglucosamine diphosphorylase/glucosamine-1-phosphate N-acetyltransferase GlmU n=1 Tax=Frankia sp. AgKG'84/4 TaxID=573490 RepID=UPI00200EAE8E|nr:bifunctional UDP-N-acetylglucosamine diphosphorylase/glucosamine-1-phosphate N-acetyltransferase GlmU [Frankia sp. AgKG'84/4]
MRSSTPKVLHRIAGRSLLEHVLHAAATLGAARTAVVLGHGREQVGAMLDERAPDVVIAVQDRQLGTGHAVRVALHALAGLAPEDTVVVLPGDAPLLAPETLAALTGEHLAAGAAATVLTAVLADATGYGRVVRDDAGRVRGIIEQRDADAATAAIREINTGVYAFRAGPLQAALTRLTTENAQGEEYLTDVVGLLVADGSPVAARAVADPAEAAGVNDRVQLAAAGRALRDRIVEAAMRDGTTVVDPQTTWIDAEVTLEPDTTIAPNTALHGRTHLARGAEVGPDCSLTDTVVGPGATVVRTTADQAEIGAGATVGPYTHLRPGTRLGREGKLGSFVETKAAVLGEQTKVPHLAYVGDAVVGDRSNIGCTTVFVNYDGVAKHRTIIGSDVRIGSDTMLVAPVVVGDGAYTGAGAVIREDVPPGALAIREGQQRTIEGWVARRRPGSPAALAAAAAAAAGTAPSPAPLAAHTTPRVPEPPAAAGDAGELTHTRAGEAGIAGVPGAGSRT